MAAFPSACLRRLLILLRCTGLLFDGTRQGAHFRMLCSTAWTRASPASTPAACTALLRPWHYRHRPYQRRRPAPLRQRPPQPTLAPRQEHVGAVDWERIGCRASVTLSSRCTRRMQQLFALQSCSHSSLTRRTGLLARLERGAGLRRGLCSSCSAGPATLSPASPCFPLLPLLKRRSTPTSAAPPTTSSLSRLFLSPPKRASRASSRPS